MDTETVADVPEVVSTRSSRETAPQGRTPGGRPPEGTASAAGRTAGTTSSPGGQLSDGPASDTFTKRRFGVPPGFFEVEVAGLRWLAEAGSSGGAAVVRPLETHRDRIVLQRLEEVPATDEAAERFGRSLAATHQAGALWFGCPPAGWTGDGFIGLLPLPHVRTPPAPESSSWGRFYARHRLHPYLRAAHDAGRLPQRITRRVDALCQRLEDGDERLTGPGDEPVSRVHGDLWAGNVLWTADGVVLVDPAAHGGHRETDLAMLALFGLPRLSAVLGAYDEAWPLADGWRERVALHQLHPLLVHVVLFGGSYVAQVEEATQQYL